MHAAEAESVLDEVTVVGSHLAQAASTAVSVITAQQIRERGFKDTTEVLRSFSENSGGGFDGQLGILSFTPAAAAVNLRDLGVGRSLVLLDGRRLPMYPVGWGGTDSFVDISSIPLSAIERVEVLTDGASAIYGSDALSGVVNIVLKKTPVNELSLQRTGTTEGGGGTQRWQLSTGARGDLGSVLLTAEYYHADPLWYAQRERSRYDQLGGPGGSGPGSFSAFGYPGTYTDASEAQVTPAPGCTVNDITPVVDGLCYFNRSAYRQLRPEQNELAAMLRVTHELNAEVGLFANAIVRRSKQALQSEPQALDARYDLGLTGPIAALPNNPYGQDGSYLRRMNELGPTQQEFDNRSHVAVLGLRGSLAADWRWELALQNSQQRSTERIGGLMLASQWAPALQGQTDFNGDGLADVFDLAQPIPDDIAQQLRYTATNQNIAMLSTVQALLQGELASGSARPVQVALLSEYARESYANRPDAALLSQDVIFYGNTSGTGQRARYAVGAELQANALTTLKVNLAARYDRYQDLSAVGGAVSPRLTLTWQPRATWNLHGAVGRSFRAPDLQRLFGGDTRGSQNVFNTPQCLVQGGSGLGDGSQPACVNSVFALTTTRANRDLAEETGMHYGLGTAWQPLPDWALSVDYFLIDLKNLVQTPSPQYVLNENAASGRFSDWITQLPSANCQVPTVDSVCLLLDLRPINIARKRTSGLDFKLNGSHATAVGRFSTELALSYLLEVSMRAADNLPAVSVLAVGQLGEAARVTGHAALSWTERAWFSSVYLNYIGPFTPVYTDVQQRIGSFTTVNLNVGYTLATRTTLQLGLNNLFDRQPPLATYRGRLSQPFFHEQFHTLDGRTWSAALRQGF